MYAHSGMLTCLLVLSKPYLRHDHLDPLASHLTYIGVKTNKHYPCTSWKDGILDFNSIFSCSPTGHE